MPVESAPFKTHLSSHHCGVPTVHSRWACQVIPDSDLISLFVNKFFLKTAKTIIYYTIIKDN